MAYGTEAKVLFNLGKSAVDTIFYTSANITLAIADADLIVDRINSSASAEQKTAASSMIAADIMLNKFQLAQTNGLDSTGGSEGGEPSLKRVLLPIPSTEAKSLLKKGLSYTIESEDT